MPSLDITAVNVRARQALANDDTICEITNLFDADGDETDNEDTALMAVIRYDDNHWFTVRLADFEKAMH